MPTRVVPCDRSAELLVALAFARSYAGAHRLRLRPPHGREPGALAAAGELRAQGGAAQLDADLGVVLAVELGLQALDVLLRACRVDLAEEFGLVREHHESVVTEVQEPLVDSDGLGLAILGADADRGDVEG